MRALALCALAACSYPEKVLIDAFGTPFEGVIDFGFERRLELKNARYRRWRRRLEWDGPEAASDAKNWIN